VKRTFILIVALFAVCLVAPAMPAQAQTTSQTVYLLTTSGTAYTVTAITPAENRSVTLLSVPIEGHGILPEVFPQDEIDALERFLVDYNEQWSSERPRSAAGMKTLSYIGSIAVSPDNRKVVVKVTYTVTLPFTSIYFGTTHLILIDLDSQERTLLLNLGYHSTQFDQRHYIDSFADEKHVTDIEWAPNQQAIAVGTIEGRAVEAGIVVIPLNGHAPFSIGMGEDWAFTPTSDQVAVLTRQGHDSDGITNTFTIVDLDLKTERFFETSCVLANYFISPDSGFAFYHDSILLQRVIDISVIEGGGGLAIMYGCTYVKMFIPDRVFTDIQSTPDAEALVLETSTRLLVRARQSDRTRHPTKFRPIFSSPVTDWHLGSDGALLVQFTEGGPYAIFDPLGTPAAAWNATLQRQMADLLAPDGMALKAVDW
jgi:hypothetical protein